MGLLGRSLLYTTHCLRGSCTAQIFKRLRSEPFRPRSEILANQFRQLSSLLSEAEAHVPYYRELFRNLRVHSCDIRTAADFASLPVLTKEIVRERPSDLLREDVRRSDLIEGNSGGSTGVPLRFYRDANFLGASEAGQFRTFSQCGWKPGEMVAYFWGGNDRLYNMSWLQFEVRQYLRRQYQFDPFHSGPEEMDHWLAKWNRVRPSVIFGYASTIARFAAHAETRGVSMQALRGVFTTAEKLYTPQREVISRVFRCPVYDCYGSSEIHHIASQCSHGSMHINSDFVVVEVEQYDHAAGDPAALIVTSLRNRVMPFIRYRNEDCGELLEGTCGCGNNFPLMQLKVSRISDNFIMPNGRVVHGEFFTHLMYGSKGIEMFQFHQTSSDRIRLLIVPARNHTEARDHAIRAAVETVQRLDPEIKVDVRLTDSIALSVTGKHRFTRSDVSASVQTNTHPETSFMAES